MHTTDHDFLTNSHLIWLENECNVNTWMCFRKTFSYHKTETPAIARIAVDSKYWLYVNGTLVIREGGLKRGPSPKGIYFDEIDLTEYLKDGANHLAILVWYFGKSGFSHLSSGRGGLMFAMQNGDCLLLSDNTWKTKKHPAFVEADPEDAPTNFRLAESNLYFDAAKDIPDWFTPDYDDSGWQAAQIFPHDDWGEFVKRIIPQLKDFGIRDYENTMDYADVTLTEDAILTMHLPYNAQFTPVLELTAPAGKKITVKTENFNCGMYDEKCAIAVYYTKDGHQAFEAYGWLNGETALYHIPAGVTIHRLAYRETGYNTEFVGSFSCDDPFLNKLWEKSRRTLYITMRDTFMDCPDRERVQWWGDVNIEMQMAMYCLDEKALLLYKKGVDSLVGWSEHVGHMMTVVPSGTDQFELPFQNLAGIWGFFFYYECTGDIDVPARAYDMSKNYLELYEMSEDGFVIHRSGSWDWPDWGEHADTKVMENAWYYMALESCKKMADLLGHTEDISFYEDRMNSIRTHFNKTFLTDGNYYYSHTDNGIPDDRANALAVLSGLATSDAYEGVLSILTTVENSSPYMEKYVLDALCEMGYVKEALIRIKRRYKDMVEEDYSTLWEFWDKSGTMNHAWSGGPLIILSKHLAGEQPMGAIRRKTAAQQDK